MSDEELGDLAALLDDVEAAVVGDMASTPQKQVARATIQRVRRRLTAESRDASTTSAKGDDLPTIVYETEHGEHRRVRYERVPGQPWQVERRIDRHDGRTWVPCGADPLAELVVDGEHRSAVTVTEGP